MKKDSYTIAIVIPCWNVDKYIHKMLDCLLLQTFQEWRAFCIDDGSTDRTADIIKSYASKDQRIEYVLRARTPKGSQTCRNIGIDMARDSKYLIFLDADDIIAPYCFAQRVDFLEKHPQLDYAIFRAKSFHHSIFESDCSMYGFYFIDNALSAMLNWNLTILAVTNIYRYKSLLDNNVRWDEQLLSLQDSDFNIQVLAKGLKYSFAKGKPVDYFYRITNNGIANKIRTPQHYMSHIYMLDKTLNTISETKMANDVVLQNNILLFYNLVRQDKDAVKKLLQIQWLRDRKCNHLKMWLYILLGGRGKKYLFPRERRFSNEMNQKWHQAIEQNVAEFLETVRYNDSSQKLEMSIKSQNYEPN